MRGLLPPYTRARREIPEPGNEELGWLVRFANPRNTRKDRRRGASLMSDTDTRRGESSWTAAAFWSTCWIVKSADALYLLAAIQTAPRAIDAETAAAKVCEGATVPLWTMASAALEVANQTFGPRIRRAAFAWFADPSAAATHYYAGRNATRSIAGEWGRNCSTWRQSDCPRLGQPIVTVENLGTSRRQRLSDTHLS